MSASPDLSQVAWEHISDYVADYLFLRHARRAKVRRIAPWVGFIVMGISALGVEARRVPRVKQLMFKYKGQWYKATYNHKAAFRGGIDILKIADGKAGAETGKLVSRLTSLEMAEGFYNACREGRWPKVGGNRRLQLAS